MNRAIVFDSDWLDEIAPLETRPNGSSGPTSYQYPREVALSAGSDGKQISFVINYSLADEPGEVEAVPGADIFPIRLRRGKEHGMILNLSAILGEPLNQQHLHAIADVLERAAAGIKKVSSRLNYRFIAKLLRETDVAAKLVGQLS